MVPAQGLRLGLALCLLVDALAFEPVVVSDTIAFWFGFLKTDDDTWRWPPSRIAMLPELLVILPSVPTRVPAAAGNVLLASPSRGGCLWVVNLAFFNDLQATNRGIINAVLGKLGQRLALFCRSQLSLLTTLAREF